MNKIERPRLFISESPFLIDIACVGIVSLEPGEIITSHKHQLHEFHFIKSGEIKIGIGKKQYNALEDCLYLIKPGVSHYQYCIKKSCIWYFSIAISQWWQPRGGWPNSGTPLPQKSAHESPLQYLVTGNNFIARATGDLKQLLVSIYDPLAQDATVEESRLVSALRAFLLQFGAAAQPPANSNREKKQANVAAVGSEVRKKIEQAVRFIDRHCTESFSMDTIARNSYISQRHFRRLFKGRTGFSPAQYLNEKRLQKALDLLKQPEMKIESIWGMAGFKNRDHFFRFFSLRTGLSPHRFKKNVLASGEKSLGVF
jgi:AraC-like DNA-binding protein